ncbi:MAG: efflux RND transporter periplasmic adaptor subunit [Ignavibacteriae bacterium]|nr:efflux RND transporter periplasmic adaptor subunit [Ignavibacteriota bacterium]
MVIMKTVARGLFLSILYISIALLLIDCGENKGSGGFSMPPMPVEVSQVKFRKVVDKFEAVGTIEAIEAITVVAEIDGAVKALPFNEGGFIKQGEIIAQLDDAQLAAEVARAEALRSQSQVTYDRVKAIVDQGAGAPQDLDDAAAALKVAQANLDLAKARFAKTRIIAPFDGIIGARRVSVGTFMRTGQSVTDLANIDEIRVTFAAPERFLSQLTRGASVAVSTTAFPGYELQGKIIAIEPIIDPTTRSTRVVARVQNPERKFRPGMSANISAVLSERPNALTIPNEAVFGSGNQMFVFIVKPDSTVARVPLTLGTRLADVVEVLDGLQQGMTVVRAGHQKLFDGGKVMPMTSQTDMQSTETKTGG